MRRYREFVLHSFTSTAELYDQFRAFGSIGDSRAVKLTNQW